MMFKENAGLYAVEMESRQGEDVMYVNYLPAAIVPSIADRMEDMARVIDLIVENSNVARVVFVQQRNYNYPFEQVAMLGEIASIYKYLVRQEAILSPGKQALFSVIPEAGQEIATLVGMLKYDPVACYMTLNKRIKEIRSIMEQSSSRSVFLVYVRVLEKLQGLLEITILIKKYDTKHFYHVMPPEYQLSEEQHMLVNLARNVLAEHRPQAEEFTDPDKTRQVFYNVARDLVSELATGKGIILTYKDLDKLARILVRHTIGFGLIEILLLDSKLQDIVLNAPIAQNPIFVRHEKYEECTTNIIPSFEDADSWAAKLRLQSGRPLDEANPVLDTDLSFGKVRARVAAIKEPLSPNGLAYAIRRHRESPWTLPLFVSYKILSPFAAGLLSFLIDGSRTLLVAGTRSSGKTSLLGALLLEIMPRYRVIIVEDTLELPADTLRKLGYNILRMKVRSALVSGSTEIEAADGIRTSLRLGDSALIVGEVRSAEAKALYEAMRVGALANVVAGTIHGDSPYGVFDRVVNDLGVEATSFKATDLILVANPVKSADGLHSERRVISLTEVRKHWQKDPLEEHGFVDLLRYNVETDQLEATPELMNGDSEIIKSIAGNVKGWAGNWDAVYDNILLRAKIKEETVETAKRLNKPSLLEAEFTTASNNVFHLISDTVRKEHGLPKSEFVFPEWKKWMLENLGNY